jgi:hypothetical protein
MCLEKENFVLVMRHLERRKGAVCLDLSKAGAMGVI